MKAKVARNQVLSKTISKNVLKKVNPTRKVLIPKPTNRFINNLKMRHSRKLMNHKTKVPSNQQRSTCKLLILGPSSKYDWIIYLFMILIIFR